MEAVRSVSRATEIVETVARSGASGARLVDIVNATSLQKTTAHRIVTSLLELGWLEQSSDGSFYLGAKIVGLGSIALNRHGLADIANPRLLALARATNDTVFLSARSGSEALCVDRVLGAFPIRTLTLQVGDRRPMGVGAGSMALLAWQEPEEIAAAIAKTVAAPRKHDLDERTLEGMVRTSVDRGYTLNDGGVILGAIGVGVPVLDKNGRAVAALSVATIASRLPVTRIEEIVGLMTSEAGQLAADLDDVTADLSEPSVRRLLPTHT